MVSVYHSILSFGFCYLSLLHTLATTDLVSCGSLYINLERFLVERIGIELGTSMLDHSITAVPFLEF